MSIIYRALNDRDQIYYNNGLDIPSNLVHYYNYRNAESKKVIETIESEYNWYFNNKRQNALDAMANHVRGKKKLSPYISASFDFDYVACEYAVIQAGNYNWDNKRKPIAIIEYDDSKLYSDNEQIRKLANKTDIDDFAVNLCNGKLNELHMKEITENEGSLGYRIGEHGEKIRTDISYADNFSTRAKEVLIYKKLKHEYVKGIIYPVVQDIIYSCNLASNLSVLFNNANVINNIIQNKIKNDDKFRKLYPNLKEGKSLTDILETNYYNKKGNNIEEEYETLKKEKKELLKSLISDINASLNTNWKISRLVDDKIFVSDIKNIHIYKGAQKHDLVLIGDGNDIFKYSHADDSYVAPNGKTIKLKK